MLAGVMMTRDRVERSLSKLFDKLESSIKSLNCNFDCIGLTETWLKDMENTDIYNIPDYILLSNPRTNKRGGGVGMYVSNSLRFKKRNDLSINSDNYSFESIFIEIEINNVCVIIGTIYRPPDTNINIFNVHFNDLLRTISNERKKCILMP